MPWPMNSRSSWFHRSDLEWAAEHAEKVNGDCGLFLQPEWDKRDDATFWILSWIATRPRLAHQPSDPQIHRIP